MLDQAWQNTETKIIVFTAWGGVGKTALVNHWLNRMQAKDFAGAQRVYAWSFYSQGAEQGKQASADEFFQQTLVWFGDLDPQQGTAIDRARRLANESKTKL